MPSPGQAVFISFLHAVREEPKLVVFCVVWSSSVCTVSLRHPRPGEPSPFVLIILTNHTTLSSFVCCSLCRVPVWTAHTATWPWSVIVRGCQVQGLAFGLPYLASCVLTHHQAVVTFVQVCNPRFLVNYLPKAPVGQSGNSLCVLLPSYTQYEESRDLLCCAVWSHSVCTVS